MHHLSARAERSYIRYTPAADILIDAVHQRMVLLWSCLLDPREEVHMVEIRCNVVVAGEHFGFGIRILQILDGRIYLVTQSVIGVRRVIERSTNRRGNERKHGRRNLLFFRLIKERRSEVGSNLEPEPTLLVLEKC